MLEQLAKNTVLGNPIRLGIMLYLIPRTKALFKDIQYVLGVTPGNLDSHLRVLQRYGYVKIKKVIVDRPRTAVWLTDLGARETKKYISLLKKALEEGND